MNHQFSIDLLFFMTSRARYLSVFSIQLKCRFIVIKFYGIPIVKRVAAQAIRDAVFFKLLFMHVFVTLCTGSGQVSKLLVPLREFSFVLVSVAGHAGLFGVCA